MAQPSLPPPVDTLGTNIRGMDSSLFDYLPLGIVVADANGEILDVNKAAQELLGLCIGGAHKPEFLSIDGAPLPPAEPPSVRAMRGRCVLADEQIGMVGPDGQPIRVELTATPLPRLAVG